MILGAAVTSDGMMSSLTSVSLASYAAKPELDLPVGAVGSGSDVHGGGARAP